MTVVAMTLAQRLAASRVYAARQAAVATLKPLFPDCTVKEHLGRLDIADVETGDSFATPSINIGVVRVHPAGGRMSGYRDVPVEFAAYVVTTDQPVAGGPTSLRDEIALALIDGVLAVLEDPHLSRWGLADIDPADNADARPLFTAKSNDKGMAYFVVDWRNTLYTLGDPFMDMESPVPAGLAPPVVLPGDPGWTPPTPPVAP